MAAPKPINLLQFLSDLDFPYMRAFMANPGLDARLGRMADAGDEAGLMRIVNKYMGREAPPVPVGRDPVPFDQRIANEPKIRQGLEEAGVPTEGMSQQDMLAEYTRQVMGAAAPRGRPRQAPPSQPPLGGKIRGKRPEDAIRELRPPEPPVRQFELPFGEEPTGLIPYGVRGPGVPVGGVRGMGSLYNPGTEMIPAPLRGIPGQTRAMAPARPRDLVVAEDIAGQFDRALAGEVIDPPRAMRPVRRPDPVVVDEGRPVFADKDRVAAGIVAAMVGGAAMLPTAQEASKQQAVIADQPALTTGGEADLVEESRPAPKVTATEEAPAPKVAKGPAQKAPGYRDQAHALQRQLNEMRMAARGEVPQAAAMKREIQRLFDLADAQTNSAVRQGAAPAPSGSGPLDAARKILAALNAGTIPPAQRGRAQAEMQRLYRMADEQANARTTARRAG